ncbi:hypothetical protein M8494_37175 [Serratia ureilytica]
MVDLDRRRHHQFRKERKRSRRFVSIPVKTALTEVPVARFCGQSVPLPRRGK